MPKKKINSININAPYKKKSIEAFKVRDWLQTTDYEKQCECDKGIRKNFKTPKHWLYWNSLFWFHHDLIIRSDKFRKSLHFIKHWELCKFLENAIHACELKHELSSKPSEFKNFKLPSDYFCEWSRATLKTTWAISAMIWVMLKHPNWTNLYARSTAKDASDVIQNISAKLRQKSLLHEYFPQLLIKSEQIRKRGGKVNKFQILLPYEIDDELYTGIQLNDEREIQVNNTLDGWGLNETYTGAHKDGFVVIDDAVTEKNYNSDEIQETIIGRLTELSSNICMETAVRVRSGTPYRPEDAFQRIKNTYKKLQKEEDSLNTGVTVAEYTWQPLLELKKPDGTYYDSELLLQYTVSPQNEYEATIGESSIVFPNLFTPRGIRQKLREAEDGPGKQYFYSQYLLKFISDDKKPFKEEWLVYFGDGTPLGNGPKREEVRMIGIIDPSGGYEKDNDNVGIVIYGVDAHSYVWIYEAIEKRLSNLDLMKEIYELHKIYRPDEWLMESISFQNTYRELIQMLLNAGKINIDGEERHFNITIDPLRSESNSTSIAAKKRRIYGASWLFETRRVRIMPHHIQFAKRYKEYPKPGNPDELMDIVGYIKERVYPLLNTNERNMYYSFDENKYSYASIKDIAAAQIRKIHEDIRKDSEDCYSFCLNCGHENKVYNLTCTNCGMPSIYRSNNSMYDIPELDRFPAIEILN